MKDVARLAKRSRREARKQAQDGLRQREADAQASLLELQAWEEHLFGDNGYDGGASFEDSLDFELIFDCEW